MQQFVPWPFPLEIQYNNTQFVLDIVTPDQPLDAILQLRYRIFCEELNYFVQNTKGNVEQDDYDAICDHLIVKDLQNNTIAASYRLLRPSIADAHQGFVSEHEFDLGTLKQHIQMIESGRACIHQNYRHRFLISLLWKGLIRYMDYFQIEYMGGCTSIAVNDVQLSKLVYGYAKNINAITPSYLNIQPNPNNRVQEFSQDYVVTNLAKAKRQLPSLLRGYLKIGAELSPEPALDLEWQVVDFFTLFHREKINNRIGHFV